jgi:hypothetical protein
MVDKKPADKPTSEQSRRRDRLSAALRENLKRRKAQTRARSGESVKAAAETAQKSLDSAGITKEKQRE